MKKVAAALKPLRFTVATFEGGDSLRTEKNAPVAERDCSSTCEPSRLGIDQLGAASYCLLDLPGDIVLGPFR